MFATLLSAALFAAQPAHAAPTDTPDTPPLILTIDGVEHPLHNAVPITITIDGKPHEIRIDLPTTARFVGDFIRFDYPASAGSQIREDRNGYFASRIAVDNAIISLYEFPGQISLATMFDSIAAQYKDTEVEHTIGDVKLKTDIATLEGRFVLVNIAGVWVRQELYRISDGKGSTFVMLQDSREEPDVPTPEYTRLTTGLAQTFQVK